MSPTYFVDFKVVATAFIHGNMTKDESKEAMYLMPEPLNKDSEEL